MEQPVTAADISALVHALEQPGVYRDSIPMEEWTGLKDIGPISINGMWDTWSDVPSLAVKVALSNVTRLPRKTKKALKKRWAGGFVSAREHRRLIASIGQ